MDSMDEIILNTLATACNVDRSVLTRDTSLADMGFDSLAAAVFAGEMETSHGITLEANALAKLYVVVTPADVIALMGEVGARAVAPEAPVARS